MRSDATIDQHLESLENTWYGSDLRVSRARWNACCDTRPEHGLCDVAVDSARPQGHKAALISHAGVMLAYLFYMLGAAFGITALFLGVPFAGSHLGAGGAAYLLYLGLVRRERRWHSAILFSWPYR